MGTDNSTKQVSITQVFSALGEIAPLRYAASWDNVGVLALADLSASVRRVLLTIDLTESVVQEAQENRCELIVAYHPPIFSPLKSLRSDAKDSKERAVARCVHAGIALYSPHTALDAAPGGVTDWLCDGLGEGSRQGLSPILTEDANAQCKVVAFVPKESAAALRSALSEAGAGNIGNYSECSFSTSGHGSFIGNGRSNPSVGHKGKLETVEEIRLEMVCSQGSLPEISRAIQKEHPYEEPAWEVYPMLAKPEPSASQGRVFRFNKPLALTELAQKIKQHLGLSHIRIAAPESMWAGEVRIQEIGVCPGAGGSLFSQVACQAYWTGEMRHHDVLAHVEKGRAVFLCEHTNTERGYLPLLRDRLISELGGLEILVSSRDKEPLRYL